MAVSSGFVCWLARRTGDSRGFAFVRYKYADEAQKAIDRLDGGVCFFFFVLTVFHLWGFWASTSIDSCA
jgi:hypothetical protein